MFLSTKNVGLKDTHSVSELTWNSEVTCLHCLFMHDLLFIEHFTFSGGINLDTFKFEQTVRYSVNQIVFALCTGPWVSYSRSSNHETCTFCRYTLNNYRSWLFGAWLCWFVAIITFCSSVSIHCCWCYCQMTGIGSGIASWPQKMRVKRQKFIGISAKFF